ncbi:MAG: hypothetical protein IPM35_30020 [Myxococcales bacterium]|nr:hypothetical protein [Myxococcales bacterium]
MRRSWLIALSCGACAGHAANVQPEVAEGQQAEAGIDSSAPDAAPARAERLCAIRHDSRGIVHEYHDAADRIVRLTRPTKVHIRLPFVRIEYDAAGRVAVLERDSSGTHGIARARYAYEDDTGFIVFVDIDGAERARRLVYSYQGTRLAGDLRFRMDPRTLDLWDTELELLPGDPIPFAGQLTIEEQPSGSGRRIEATYDPVGRLSRVRVWSGTGATPYAYQYSRNGDGQLTEVDVDLGRFGRTRTKVRDLDGGREAVERRCP